MPKSLASFKKFSAFEFNKLYPIASSAYLLLLNVISIKRFVILVEYLVLLAKGTVFNQRLIPSVEPDPKIFTLCTSSVQNLSAPFALNAFASIKISCISAFCSLPSDFIPIFVRNAALSAGSLVLLRVSSIGPTLSQPLRTCFNLNNSGIFLFLKYFSAFAAALALGLNPRLR